MFLFVLSLLFQLFLLALALALAYAIWNYVQLPERFPAGPWGFPFVGYAPLLGRKPHIILAHLKQNYGDIFSINTGRELAVVLSSYKAIKAALIDQAENFSLRPLYHQTQPQSIQNNLKKYWSIRSQQRNFTVTSLKKFGAGKTSLEPQIKEELVHFIDCLKEFNGRPANINTLLRMSMANIVCIILTGRRVDYEHPTFEEMLRLTDALLHEIEITRLKSLIPYALLDLLGETPRELGIRMRELVNGVVENHITRYESGKIRSFLDAWFLEMEREDVDKTAFNREQLVDLIVKLFLGGSDTTSNTLRWGILHLIKHPQIQMRIQEEIDQVVGRERLPTMTDEEKMPFTQATLLEISRITTILPLGVLHSTERDATLLDFTIPKGTTIITNLWAVHHDEELFPRPFDFNPDRFLTDENQVKVVQELIPYGIGKRQCLGEPLANMQLFLYFTAMLQSFSFTNEKDTELDFDYDYALVSIPKPQNIRAVPR